MFRGIDCTIEKVPELLALRFLADQTQRSHDDGEAIVEVVGDAAGQLPDHFHFLRLTQLFLDAPLLRALAVDDADPDDLALVAEHRELRYLQPVDAAVGEGHLLRTRHQPAAFQHLTVLHVVGVQVVVREDFLRGLAESVLRRDSVPFLETSVDHAVAAVAILEEDGRRRVVDNRAKPLFALA